VEEVDYLGPWAGRLGTVMTLVGRGALLVALIIAFACVYIVASTIRLGVHARREEIEIQKLVGATDRFIRAPLLVEGALQGALGALLACGLLFGVYRWAGPGIEEVAASLLSRIDVCFLTSSQILLGVAGGALLGLAGSSIAVSRYVKV
jgi:cell division transport system permease protein